MSGPGISSKSPRTFSMNTGGRGAKVAELGLLPGGDASCAVPGRWERPVPWRAAGRPLEPHNQTTTDVGRSHTSRPPGVTRCHGR